MKVNEKLSRFVSCSLILTLKRNRPEAVNADKVLKVVNFDLLSRNIKVAFLPIDAAEVGMKAS
jgi:hypothetical protein